MTNPWIPLLANLPLSRTEREVVKRFEGDPEGRTFLPVADILRAHRLVDESLELLTQGVERHKSFTVARVVLARELLQKGMVAESWRIIEESPVPLRDNLLAQKLRFRLAVLLADETIVRATHHHLKLNQMLDADSKRLGDILEISGLAAAREKLIKDLRDRGTEPILPTTKIEAASPAAVAGAKPPNFSAPTAFGEPGAPVRDVNPFFPDDSFDRDGRLAGFHVVPLDEIFRPGDLDAPRAGGKAAGGVELDSSTLADIYARQGHYSRALEVYRRLLRATPHNEMVQRKVAELLKLDREQKEQDLSIDPALVDRMETVEIIDRQIKFFQQLLDRLT